MISNLLYLVKSKYMEFFVFMYSQLLIISIQQYNRTNIYWALSNGAANLN